jgi:hypothetical protein
VLIGASVAVSSNCTQDNVALCAAGISTVRPCVAGVRCDAACSSQVHYAQCLQAIACDADMYQGMLDECYLGRLHVASAALHNGSGSCSVFAGNDPAEGLGGSAWDRPLTAAEAQSLRHAIDAAHWEKRGQGATPRSAPAELTLLHARDRFLDIGPRRDGRAGKAAAAGVTAAAAAMEPGERAPLHTCELAPMVASLYDHCTALVPPCTGAEFQRLDGLAQRLSQQCNASNAPADAEQFQPAVVGVMPFARADATVVIRTVGRNSVAAAVRSALREQFPVLVIADGPSAGSRAVRTLQASNLHRSANVTFVEVSRRQSVRPAPCACPPRSSSDADRCLPTACPLARLLLVPSARSSAASGASMAVLGRTWART